MEKQKQNQPNTNISISIDKKSKILLLVFILFIIGAVAITYWRTFIRRDYIIEAQIDCDPASEACFIWQCDPGSTEEGEACTGDPEKDIWYYKIIKKNASQIPVCDPNSEECSPLSCEENEKDCEMTLCTPENVKEGETCNDPVKYNEENPPEEELTCEEGNEECQAASEEACSPDDENCNVAPTKELNTMESEN